MFNRIRRMFCCHKWEYLLFGGEPFRFCPKCKQWQDDYHKNSIECHWMNCDQPEGWKGQ